MALKGNKKLQENSASMGTVELMLNYLSIAASSITANNPVGLIPMHAISMGSPRSIVASGCRRACVEAVS